MKNRSVIYDFDNTIFDSPTKEKAELIHPVPFNNWYWDLRSLHSPYVPEIPDKDWFIEKTVNSYLENKEKEDTEVILMTGRCIDFKPRVLQICSVLDLVFDKYFFKPKRRLETFNVKKEFILKDIIHENTEIIEIWEDRVNHAESFKLLGEQIKKDMPQIKEVIVHIV